MTALSAFVNKPQPLGDLTGLFEPNILWIVAGRSQKLLVHLPRPSDKDSRLHPFRAAPERRLLNPSYAPIVERGMEQGIPVLSGGNNKVMGHTGAGPGSVVAVYRQPEAAPRITAAAFAFGDDLGQVEEAVCRMG